MMPFPTNSALAITRKALMSIADLRADRRRSDDYNKGWEHGRYQAIKIAEHALDATKETEADDEEVLQPVFHAVTPVMSVVEYLSDGRNWSGPQNVGTSKSPVYTATVTVAAQGLASRPDLPFATTLQHMVEELPFRVLQPSHMDESKVSTLSETEATLTIDLTQAIEAAYYAGAKDWVRNTHPEHFTRLEAINRKVKPTIEETTAVRRLMDHIWGGSWVRHTAEVQDVKMQASVDLLRPVFAPDLDRVREVVKAMSLATPFSINASTAEAAVEWMRSLAMTGINELNKVDRRPK